MLLMAHDASTSYRVGLGSRADGTRLHTGPPIRRQRQPTYNERAQQSAAVAAAAAAAAAAAEAPANNNDDDYDVDDDGSFDEYETAVATALRFNRRHGSGSGAVQVYDGRVRSFIQEPPGVRVWALVIAAWGQWRKHVRVALEQRQAMRRAAWHAEATLLRRIVFHWRLATPGITRSRRVYEATRVRGVYYSASFRR